MNLTLEQTIKIVSALLSNDTDSDPNISASLLNKHVLVRNRSAGVHIGTLVAKKGTNVVLTNARRLWSWKGAFTLSEVATRGIDSKESRMACPVETIELTEAIEIIPTTEQARKTYEVCNEK